MTFHEQKSIFRVNGISERAEHVDACPGDVKIEVAWTNYGQLADVPASHIDLSMIFETSLQRF